MTQKVNQKQETRKIQVAVRMRPLLHLLEDEQVWEMQSQSKTITSLNPNTNPLNNLSDITNHSFLSISNNSKQKKKSAISAVEKTHRYQFTYDYAFDPSHTNSDIYQKSCKHIIQQFCQKGRNGTIFMYGQTTSGKTYTMLGDEHTHGLISYSLSDICELLLQTNATLTVSYIEIYNEQINDLLNPGASNLRIADDQIIGAETISIHSFQQVMQLLESGEQQRSYSQKKYHDHSSRSHTIFQVRCCYGKTKSVLNLVDLAGSQRLSDEETNQETGYINKSLFVLSTVIQRLAVGKKNAHVPFRDSKLTRILAPSLSGQSLTTVICTISPAALNFYQTLSTLRFASCSRKVELKPFSNSPQLHRENSSVTNESKEINILKQENERLKKELTNTNPDQKFLTRKVHEVSQLMQQMKPKMKQDWKNKLNMLCSEYERNISTLQKEYTKALMNAVSIECEIEKQKIEWLLSQFQ